MRGVDHVRIGADIGGPFTDVVLNASWHRTRIRKLTTHKAPEIALIDAVLALLDESGCDARDVALIVHGTTLAAVGADIEAGLLSPEAALRGYACRNDPP